MTGWVTGKREKKNKKKNKVSETNNCDEHTRALVA